MPLDIHLIGYVDGALNLSISCWFFDLLTPQSQDSSETDDYLDTRDPLFTYRIKLSEIGTGNTCFATT